MKRPSFLALAAAGLAWTGPAPAQEEVPFPCLGRIKARHAREIRASDWSVGAETMDRDFTVYANWKKHLGPLGFKKARIQAGWAKTEKEKGRYDWAWLDEIIPDMVEQGVEPWVCLCYGNPVYPEGGGTGLGGGLPKSEEALAGWDRFVAAFVDRYRKHVDEWEVWNEPGLRGANSAKDYADLLVRTARVVRQQQPGARILALGMAGINLKLAGAVLERVREMDALDLIDEVTYHPYSYNPDQSYKAVGELRRVVAGFSERIRLRQGENGAPSKAGGFGAIGKYDWDEERQAKWALRRLLGDLGRDIPSSYFSICDMQYPDRMNYKGLLAVNPDKTVHHPKQAYFALQRVAAVFDGSVKRIGNFTCKVAGGAEGSAFSVFGYRTEVGSIVTLWRSSHKPGERPGMERVRVETGVRFKDPVWADLLSGKVHDLEDGLWKTVPGGCAFEGIPVYDSVVLIADRETIPLEPDPARRNP